MDGRILLALGTGWLCAVVVNYLGDVLPRRRSLARPFCIACNQDQVSLIYSLFPVRCSQCNAPRNLRSWLVFLGGLAVAAFLWLDPEPRLPFWLNCLIWLYFGLVIVIDMEHRLILHITSLAGLLLGLVVGIQLHGLQATLWGGAAGFVFMLGMFWLGNLFVRLVNRRKQRRQASDAAEKPGDITGELPVDSPESEEIEDALGFGDVNLAGVIGLFLGWPGITAGLILAILLGGAVSLLYLVVAILSRRYQAFAAIPYGPFLAIAVLFLLYFS